MLGGDGRVYPVLRGLLVGWNQALWLCQELHQLVAERVAAVDPANRFTDRAAAAREARWGLTCGLSGAMVLRSLCTPQAV